LFQAGAEAEEGKQLNYRLGALDRYDLFVGTDWLNSGQMLAPDFHVFLTSMPGFSVRTVGGGKGKSMKKSEKASITSMVFGLEDGVEFHAHAEVRACVRASVTR
jgi:hypothetical protein